MCFSFHAKEGWYSLVSFLRGIYMSFCEISQQHN
uniref:Uncharacterized protein n=1 Tax=Arundo donax TaxID=35708 RepID=A0A0A8ZPK2_ARUDO